MSKRARDFDSLQDRLLRRRAAAGSATPARPAAAASGRPPLPLDPRLAPSAADAARPVDAPREPSRPVPVSGAAADLSASLAPVLVPEVKDDARAAQALRHERRRFLRRIGERLAKSCARRAGPGELSWDGQAAQLATCRWPSLDDALRAFAAAHTSAVTLVVDETAAHRAVAVELAEGALVLDEAEREEAADGDVREERDAGAQARDEGALDSAAAWPADRPADGLRVADKVHELLLGRSVSEREQDQQRSELFSLLTRPTAAERAKRLRFTTRSGRPPISPGCPHLTQANCMAMRARARHCHLLHYRPVVRDITDVRLGECQFLDACRDILHCPYVHYEVEREDLERVPHVAGTLMSGVTAVGAREATFPAQYINCDVLRFPMPVLGQFSVIMADPPWDIRMKLPYGTIRDEIMPTLGVGELQTDGYIFLWVTHRAMELGRECLRRWGYRRVDEIVWIKTTQIQGLVRGGRTGHWFNHSNEHCLVGVKGRPDAHSARLDADVIAAEVRETSRKPDEIYSIIERLSPGTRKLEIFGRMHNLRPGWVTIGNQLDDEARILDPALLERYRAAFPASKIELASPAAAIGSVHSRDGHADESAFDSSSARLLRRARRVEARVVARETELPLE